jgi:hypothetical protein
LTADGWHNSERSKLTLRADAAENSTINPGTGVRNQSDLPMVRSHICRGQLAISVE